MKNFLKEDEVNSTNLYELFDNNKLMEASRDEDDNICIKMKLGNISLIQVLSQQKMLKYVSMFGFKAQAEQSEKLDFLNRLNSEIILSRFSMPRGDVLLSEYFLPYEEGIDSNQIINCLILFERVTTSAIRQLDTDDLVG